MGVRLPGDRRGRIAAAVTAVLAAGGATLLGIGLTAQTAPPQPAPSVLAAPVPTSASASAPDAARAADPGSAATVGPVLAASIPTRLDIPVLGVHHDLIQLGQNPDGTVAVPPLEQVATPGWYRYSPTPGQLGPAAIYGHVDAAQFGQGVFYRLGAMRPGQTVEITRADHTVAVFTVTAVREYPKQAFPTLQVYGNLDHAGLRLITCGGPFDPATRNYRDNIVVYAHLTGAHPAT